MNGHQIIAVEMSDGHLQLVNPNKRSFSQGRINEKFEFGKDIDALNHGKPEFRITVDKPLTPKEHDEIDSPEKLQAVYSIKKYRFDSASRQIKNEFYQTNQNINLADLHQHD